MERDPTNRGMCRLNTGEHSIAKEHFIDLIVYI